MINVTSKGDYTKTKDFLHKLGRGDFYSSLDEYGQLGVLALANSTPVDTGLARASWWYRIIKGNERVGIEWGNSDIENGTSVVILLQYGHGTGTGGYVAGRDFINPAMRPVFDKIITDLWEGVNRG